MKGKIFNAQEVQAIISGNKTQFREVIKPQPWYVVMDADFKKGNNIPKFGHDEKVIKCPYQVGQKIFCKESWNAFSGETLGTPLGKMRLYSYPPKQGDIITYKADADLTKDFTSYLSSRTMPQWASRLTLEITGVKVERLAELDEITMWEKEGFNCHERIQNGEQTTEVYRKLWNSTHKKPEEKFEASPWVWVVSCEVVK